MYKKIISMICLAGVLSTTSVYAQSKKEIIATQQTQIQQQQAQIDSLRVANAYLQGYQDQLMGQVGQLNLDNARLSQQNLQFQHQIDSLNLVQTVLRQTIEQQEQTIQKQQARADKLQQEQNRQRKAQAQQKRAQQQKEEQEVQQMLADYRKGCANSESRLKDVFNKDPYHTGRFSQTKTALLTTYNEQCQSGQAVSLNQVKWEISIHEGYIDKSPKMWYWHQHQYTFLVECPSGLSYQAYQFCFQTHEDLLNDRKRVFSGFVPCEEEGRSVDVHR